MYHYIPSVNLELNVFQIKKIKNTIFKTNSIKSDVFVQKDRRERELIERPKERSLNESYQLDRSVGGKTILEHGNRNDRRRGSFDEMFLHFMDG